MASIDQQLKTLALAITDAIWSRALLTTVDKTTVVNALNEVFAIAKTEVVHFWWKFLLKNASIVWWLDKWPVNNLVRTKQWVTWWTVFNRRTWWFSFPYNVRIKRLHVWHRNTNSQAQPWWWVVHKQSKTLNSNIKTDTTILNQVTNNLWVWPNNYLNVKNQLTDIDISILPNNILLAGEVLSIWIDSPTASPMNYYVDIESAYIEVERII